MARKLVLKTLQEQVGSKALRFRYAQILAEVIENAGARGLTIGEMAKRLDLRNKLRAALAAEADEVVIEETEWTVLKQALAEFPFNAVYESALELAKDLDNAVEV